MTFDLETRLRKLLFQLVPTYYELVVQLKWERPQNGRTDRRRQTTDVTCLFLSRTPSLLINLPVIYTVMHDTFYYIKSVCDTVMLAAFDDIKSACDTVMCAAFDGIKTACLNCA